MTRLRTAALVAACLCVCLWPGGIQVRAQAQELPTLAAPVNDLAALFADPQVRARESFVGVEDPWLGTLQLVAPAPRLEGSPARIRSTGPELGAHNEEIYAGELGLTRAELTELRGARVI